MLVPLPDEPEVGVVAVGPAAAVAEIVSAVVEVAFVASAVVAEVPAAVAVAIAVVDDDDDIERSTLHVWAPIRNGIDTDRSTVETTVLTVGMTVECNARLVN